MKRKGIRLEKPSLSGRIMGHFLLLFPCIFPMIRVSFWPQSHIYMLSELEFGSNWLHAIWSELAFWSLYHSVLLWVRCSCEFCLIILQYQPWKWRGGEGKEWGELRWSRSLCKLGCSAAGFHVPRWHRAPQWSSWPLDSRSINCLLSCFGTVTWYSFATPM